MQERAQEPCVSGAARKTVREFRNLKLLDAQIRDLHGWR